MSDIFASEKEVTKKPKRKLTQKQIDALARGRAKAAEKRKQKKLNDKMELDAVKQKKEQRAVAKNTLKEQNLLEQTIIREREEKKRSDIYGRQERWCQARLHALGKCKTKAQFEEVSKILDKAAPDDFKEAEGISKRFSSIIKNAEQATN